METEAKPLPQRRKLSYGEAIESYQPRIYRHWVKDENLTSFNVIIKETDLCIRALSNLRRKACKLVLKYRRILEEYIERNPVFLTSLEPLTVNEDAPHIIKEMATASRKAGVGPMASVAGALAEFVGRELLSFSPEIIVENGGDIYLKSLKKRIIGIHAGKSLLTGKIGLEIRGEDTPLGICTSSGIIGHSFSYGKADAVIALAKSTALADAAATAIGNLITQPRDFDKGIELAKTIEGLKGIAIIKEDKLGIWGDLKISPTLIG
jgi:ApbE superfamily uncharacterized protein (UPF0280 family)